LTERWLLPSDRLAYGLMGNPCYRTQETPWNTTKMQISHIALRIASAVDEKRTLGFLKQLVRTPSVSGDETQVTELVAREMEHVGLSVESIGTNLIGKWNSRSDGNNLILCGHLDTVPVGDRKEWVFDPYGAEVRGNRLYGRGACDMKAGLSAMTMAVNALKKADVKLLGNLTLIATVCEEVPEKLTERKGIVELLDRNAVKGKAAIIAEPTDLVIGLGHKATCQIVAKVKGKAAHAGVPDQGINAIEKAAKLIMALKELHTANHPTLGKGTVSANLIEGGTAINVVPENCRVEIDRRLTIGENSEKAMADLQKIIRSIQKEDEDFKAEARCVFSYEPILIDASQPIIKSLAEAYSLVVGRTPRTGTLPYGTDGAFINHRTNIPVAIFGPGNMKHAHKPDEYVELEQVQAAAKIYAVAAVEFLGVHAP